MRRVILVSALLALCLSGCASDKSFEKEILGHPAPESPSDTGWSRTPATPPPPPPPAPVSPPPAAVAPPVTSAPRPAPPAAASPYTPAPVAAPAVSPPAPEAQPYKLKLFTPAPPASAQAPGTVPAPAQRPAPVAARPAQVPPQAASGGQDVFTFQVGAFAHVQTAKELLASLEKRGFSGRIEQGKLNNKTYYKVYAAKAGNRAELENELLSVGVTEPRLVQERPIGAAKAPQKAPAPAARQPEPAVTAKPSAPIAPPIVEPAPPLPDGYVPPPKKNAS